MKATNRPEPTKERGTYMCLWCGIRRQHSGRTRTNVCTDCKPYEIAFQQRKQDDHATVTQDSES